MDLYFNTNFKNKKENVFIGKTNLADVTDSYALPEKLFTDKNLKIGVVIGTYAATPYIHLGLESWKRNYPHVSVLVHDDCSRSQTALADLCFDYGADFECNSFRMPPCVGDMTAYLGGFYWARENNIDILVKMSRRFIPIFDWTKELIEKTQETQFATYTSYCDHFNFGFRSECVAMHVPTWHKFGLVSAIKEKVLVCEELFVEGYLHDLARRLSYSLCHKNDEYMTSHKMPLEKSGYGILDFMGPTRVHPKKNLLWHDSHEPEEYYKQAMRYGINYYNIKDFENPNA